VRKQRIWLLRNLKVTFQQFASSSYEKAGEISSISCCFMTPEPLPEAFIKNWTITNMRNEIAKGAAWLTDFNWALRTCDSPALPFVVSELPFMASGPRADLADAMRDAETLLFFPLCWQACLTGSRQVFHVENDRFGAGDMRRFAKMYRDSAKLFVISPSRLDFG